MQSPAGSSAGGAFYFVTPSICLWVQCYSFFRYILTPRVNTNGNTLA